MKLYAHLSPGGIVGGHIRISSQSQEGGITWINSAGEPERVVEVGGTSDGGIAVCAIPNSHVC